MSERQRSAALDDLGQVIEANIAGYFAGLGRVPGADVRDDAALLLAAAGSPTSDYNVVLRCRVADEEAERTIDEVTGVFRERRLNMVWYTSASTRPPDLGARLEARGLVRGPEIPGMAADVAADVALAPAETPAPETFAITPVDDLEQMRRWVSVYCANRNHAPATVAAYLGIHAAVGLGPDAPWRHYLGWLRGEPVATMALYIDAGAVGIYRVARLTEARGQGVGTAMLRDALRRAHAEGCRYAILDAMPDVVPLYRRLGFEVYCTFATYFWGPQIGKRD